MRQGDLEMNFGVYVITLILSLKFIKLRAGK
jgi:hypothetical protein